ncbi:2-hydroxycarboxylate transporter family protein [Nesterenkonia sp. CL21]|uniref:2-hydroxycarboxylate transporter family protein n=1 Tax=Nesterenkonia sp. CL21 TaxID=3064894 RepID=UPI002879E626|nr:2-hydroxycarboxylate transporter family protein [Nesterenkonia sp. CL21]MDS2172438.1 2-hydroxycarboxylate transporter family protein [Nesterenkonia sp. CL21]
MTTETQTTAAPKVAGLSWPLFLISAAAFVLAALTGVLPEDGILPGAVFATLVGMVLMWLGRQSRVLRTLGAPTLFTILVPSILNHFGLIPETLGTMLGNFLSGYQVLDLFIATLMVGSILGLSADVLKKSILRFLVPLLSAIAAGIATAGFLAWVLGLGLMTGILNVGLAIAGAGTGSSAIPMAEIYSDATGSPAGVFLAVMIPAVIFANFVAVMIAVLYNWLAKKPDRPFRGFNGQGTIMRGGDGALEQEDSRPATSAGSVLTGLMITGMIYIVSVVIHSTLTPGLHYFAWICILAVVFKLSGRCPDYVQHGAVEWFDITLKYVTPAVLVAVSVAVVDFAQVIEVVKEPAYLVVITGTVVVIAVVAGGVGYLMKMHFLEASLTAGLCTANMGAGGDVITLSTAGRLHLMPYAAIASRVGGTIVLITASLFAGSLL